MAKPKVAIYDFTDCEGCEVALVSLKEKLLTLEKKVDIVDWRLGQERKEDGPFDITIIEGTPITQEEIDLLKHLREQSRVLVALGSCATIAGIPGLMDKENRQKWYDKIYGKEYKPRGVDSLPLSAYVPVDFLIHGCPVDQDQLLRVFEELLSGKTPTYRHYSVCFECKQAGNRCRLLDKKMCLGPITQGGCGAVCISGGSPCYGCFNYRKEANIEALLKILKKDHSPKEIDRHFKMFLNKTKDYKERVKPNLEK